MLAATRVMPESGQDRAIALPINGGYLVAVADGAGGTGSGASAADRFIALVSGLANDAASTDWFAALCDIDDNLSARASGQTTGIVAVVDGKRVRGASVGDSSAWLVSSSGLATDLTARQRRRPLLGSGESLPVVFEAEIGKARLLLASDGLFKYANSDRICALANQASASEAVDALVNCVRLPSGALQDDISVVIVTV